MKTILRTLLLFIVLGITPLQAQKWFLYGIEQTGNSVHVTENNATGYLLSHEYRMAYDKQSVSAYIEAKYASGENHNWKGQVHLALDKFPEVIEPNKEIDLFMIASAMGKFDDRWSYSSTMNVAMIDYPYKPYHQICEFESSPGIADGEGYVGYQSLSAFGGLTKRTSFEARYKTTIPSADYMSDREKIALKLSNGHSSIYVIYRKGNESYGTVEEIFGGTSADISNTDASGGDNGTNGGSEGSASPIENLPAALNCVWTSRYGNINWQEGWYDNPGKKLKGKFIVKNGAPTFIGSWYNNGDSGGVELTFDDNYTVFNGSYTGGSSGGGGWSGASSCNEGSKNVGGPIVGIPPAIQCNWNSNYGTINWEEGWYKDPSQKLRGNFYRKDYRLVFDGYWEHSNKASGKAYFTFSEDLQSFSGYYTGGQAGKGDWTGSTNCP